MFQGRQPTNAEIASLLGLGNARAPSMARPQFSFPAPRFVPTGTIKPTPKSIAGSIQATIAKGLQKVGMGERRAHQYAARTMLPLTDATPVGNVTGAEEGKNTFKRGLTKGDLGTMGLGAASFLLSAAPLPGAVKRGGKKLGTGMFGSMLKDKGGALGSRGGSDILGGVRYPMAPRDEWYGDADYLQRGARLVEMPVDDFLSQVRPLEIDDIARDNIDDLKAHIQAGRTLDPLMIGSGKAGHDGRHRAYAAKELGIQSVPVILFGR